MSKYAGLSNLLCLPSWPHCNDTLVVINDQIIPSVRNNTRKLHFALRHILDASRAPQESWLPRNRVLSKHKALKAIRARRRRINLSSRKATAQAARVVDAPIFERWGSHQSNGAHH